MSYSFTIRADTKEAALKAVSDQLDQIVTAQPIHAADRQQAYACTEAFIEIVPPADGFEYNVSVHGSVGWKQEAADSPNVITSASVGVTVHLVAVAKS